MIRKIVDSRPTIPYEYLKFLECFHFKNEYKINLKLNNDLFYNFEEKIIYNINNYSNLVYRTEVNSKLLIDISSPIKLSKSSLISLLDIIQYKDELYLILTNSIKLNLLTFIETDFKKEEIVENSYIYESINFIKLMHKFSKIIFPKKKKKF